MITMGFRSRNYHMSNATGHLRMSVRAIAITWRVQRFIERRLSTHSSHAPCAEADVHARRQRANIMVETHTNSTRIASIQP
jgi:hypothetical protein